jgi:hypothetical protein
LRLPADASRMLASPTPDGQPHVGRAPAGHSDAGQLDASRPSGRLPEVLKPGIHGVKTHWIRGFMAFQLARCGRFVMLMVPACPESGFLGRAAWALPIS